MENNNTATPRQRWALYCITKKDYRNEILSKEEAAKLIKELGDPNYKKKSAKKNLSDELLDYIKEHFDEMFDNAARSLKLRSVVTLDEPNKKPKHFAFVGVGCGITYFKFRKNNKLANEINDLALKFRNGEVEKMFLNKFTTKEIEYYNSIGCPLIAIWTQDQNMQNAYYNIVKNFAKTKGIEMTVVSYLD